jgi:hypothetical protein
MAMMKRAVQCSVCMGRNLSGGGIECMEGLGWRAEGGHNDDNDEDNDLCGAVLVLVTAPSLARPASPHRISQSVN